jgi:hypothetical protein
MHKDQDLGKSGEYPKHSRNTALGKAGTNRTKRHRVKQSLPEGHPEIAAPAKPKEKKRWGIQSGKYTNWYKTEKARDQAFKDAEKAHRLVQQSLGYHYAVMQRVLILRLHEMTKVQR